MRCAVLRHGGGQLRIVGGNPLYRVCCCLGLKLCRHALNSLCYALPAAAFGHVPRHNRLDAFIRCTFIIFHSWNNSSAFLMALMTETYPMSGQPCDRGKNSSRDTLREGRLSMSPQLDSRGGTFFRSPFYRIAILDRPCRFFPHGMLRLDGPVRLPQQFPPDKNKIRLAAGDDFIRMLRIDNQAQAPVRICASSRVAPGYRRSGKD